MEAAAEAVTEVEVMARAAGVMARVAMVVVVVALVVTVVTVNAAAEAEGMGRRTQLRP